MAEDIARLVVALEAKIDQFEKKLDRATGVANKKAKQIEQRFAETNARLTASFKGAAEAAQLIHGPLSGISSRITTVSSVISRGNTAWATLALGVGGATFAATQALEAYQKFETQSLVLQQVLRATGGASGKTAADLESLADSIGMSTLATDDSVRAAAGTLLTFRSVAGDTFDEALRLSQDLAAVGFGTLESSAVQLGKALEDPVRGLVALRKSGVSFSEAQKQVIANLVETGRVGEAQTLVLAAIRKQVGGAGAAAAGGLEGAYHKLSESTDNLLVSWGKQIAEAIDLRAKILGVAGAMNQLNKATGGGSLDDQLSAVNERIDANQARKRPVGMAGLSFDRTQDQELKELYAERSKLRGLNLIAELDKAEAAKKSADAQKEIAEQERAGKIAEVTKELDDQRKVAGKIGAEREKSLALTKAQVTAESAAGQQIIKTIDAINAANIAAQQRLDLSSRRDTAEAQRGTLGMSAEDAAIAIETQKKLAEYRAAGIPLSEAQAAAIGREVAETVRLEEANKRLFAAYDEVATQSKELLSTFAKDIKDGTSATEALGNALDSIANKLIDMAANDLVEAALGAITGKGGNSTGGGLGASILKLIGFAGGGVVRGPGSGTSDSVPARLSNGEFVVNAAATRKHQPLLEAINSGKMRSFAEGGPVSIPRVSVPTVAASAGGGGVTVNFAPVINMPNATEGAVDKAQTDMIPKLRKMVQAEIANTFDRKARFSRSGL